MKIFLTVLLAFVSLNFFSQVKNKSFKKNTIYAELLGQGSLWSLNYERKFAINEMISQTVSVGFTTNRNVGDLFLDQSFFNFGNGFYFGSPLSYHLIIGKRSSHLDLGIGLTGLYYKGAGWYHDGFCTSSSPDIRSFKSYIVPSISYRFQKNNGGLFFKMSYSPMFSFYQTNNLNFIGRSNKNKFFEKKENLILWPGLSLGYTF
jgi:hypothetical protein